MARALHLATNCMRRFSMRELRSLDRKRFVNTGSLPSYIKASMAPEDKDPIGALLKHIADLKREHRIKLSNMAAEYEAETKRMTSKHNAELTFLRLDGDLYFGLPDLAISVSGFDSALWAHSVVLVRILTCSTQGKSTEKHKKTGSNRKNWETSVCHFIKLPFGLPRFLLSKDFRYKLLTSLESSASRSIIFKDAIETTAATAPSHIKEISTDAYSFGVMDAVISFCYDGKIEFTQNITAQEVLKVAHEYEIDYLKDVCTDELIKTLNEGNVREVLRLSKTCDARRLQELAWKYLEKENFNTMFRAVLANL